MWLRKVFCEKCGAEIDQLVSPKKEDRALDAAMLLGDSRAIHRQQTGCAGDHRGWRFGPWEELPETEGVKGK